MEIETDYAVKLFFSTSTFVQIYFEAVANAFDAEANEVTISIATDPLEVTIEDNGQGLTDDRFGRFARLSEPSDRFHKGLGRLVYLNYFSNVDVISTFGRTKRTFAFSNKFNGKSKTTEAAEEDQQGTTLRFSGFLRHRVHSNGDLKPAVLKEKLVEQFLPLLHDKKKKGHGFKISIKLDTRSPKAHKDLFDDSQTIGDLDVPKLERRAFQDKSLDLFGEISMSYVVRQGLGEQSLTAACIDGRAIPIKLLGPNAIPASCSAIFLFESDLFTGRSDGARQRLVLPETISDATLHRVLRREMGSVLNEELPEINKKNTSTKQRYEEQYPHLIGLFEEATVGLIDKDEVIEAAQRIFFKKQKEVLESDLLDDATFEKSLEVSSRTLTEYILYREIIIKRLGEITAENKETDIHNLIVPQRERYHESALIDGIYNNNAWLLDDKFMSFRTILSEATMKEVTAAIALSEDAVEDDGRPDISMIFSADPTKKEKVDVVVVEIKRRTVSHKENSYASLQLVQRAEKLVDYWPTIQRIWYFAVIEIDDALSRTLLNTRWTPLFSRGRVFYQEFPVARSDGVAVPTPICLLSYDAIIKDAAARNHTFLEILKSSFKRAKPATP